MNNTQALAAQVVVVIGPEVRLGGRMFWVRARHALVQFKTVSEDDEIEFRILPDGVLYASWNGVPPCRTRGRQGPDHGGARCHPEAATGLMQISCHPDQGGMYPSPEK